MHTHACAHIQTHTHAHTRVRARTNDDFGIQIADVDETVFLVVDPHFGVIDDAGSCVCVCRVCS